MITISDIEKYDPSGMHKVYEQWPQIANESYHSDLPPIDFENIEHIVFSGMGGSGTIGDLFSAILSKTNIHVNVVKGYLLPKTVNSKTLVITTSVSGNTVETLTALESASETNCKIIAFSSGGKIEEFCKSHKIEHRKIKNIHSPRASFTAYAYSILKVLEPIIPIEKDNILESLRQLENTHKKISCENLSESNPSLKIANWLDGIPLVYFPAGLQASAIRFKNSLQENAKTHAMIEDVIEACHNNIVSWEHPLNVKPILIQGKDDYFKTKERWEILKNFFDIQKIDYQEIMSLDGDILSKIVNLIYLLDYSSIYYSIIHGIDPTPIEPIDFVKSNL